MMNDNKKFATDVAEVVFATSQSLKQLEGTFPFKVLKFLRLCRTREGIWSLYRHFKNKTPLPDVLFHDLRVRLYQMSLKAVKEGSYGELSLSEFAEAVSTPDVKGVFILGSRMLGWFEPFKQRHHHIAEFLRDNGYIVVCVMNPHNSRDMTHGIRSFSKNMYLVNFEVPDIRQAVLRTIVECSKGNVFFHLVGTEPGTSIEDIEWLQKHGATIYYEYCDEISKEIFSGLSQMQIDRHKYLLSDSNILVSTTAQKLYDNVLALRKVEKNVFLSRNAVTLEDWDYNEKRDGIPSEMKPIIALNKPIIGFYGSFAPWLDYVSLRTLAEQRPDYQIVMIGYDYEWGKGAFAKSGISNLPNVHIVPAQQYKNLKKFSYWFDVGILPFRIYELTETVSPVKIFEYMAQGLPVVAAALPECKLYKSVLTFTNPDEFVLQVDKALGLKHDCNYKRLLRIDAEANTWKERGAQVLSELNKFKDCQTPVRQPILSVGIPLYNMERLLGRCLDSLLKPGVLTERNRIEVIVVNDGSKDNSLAIARDYQKRYPNVVKIINKENGGHGSCINAATKFAMGKYFKLLDSDDYMDSLELISHLNFLEANDVDLAICDYRQVYEGGGENAVSYQVRLRPGVHSFSEVATTLSNSYDYLSYVHMHAITYRTRILKNIRITEKSYFVDQEYITLPLINCRIAAYQPICLYQYQLGRPGQSVDPAIIKKRIGQNLAILKNVFAFYESVVKKSNGPLSFYLQGVLYNQSWYYLTNTDNEDGYAFVIKWWRNHSKGLRHDYNLIIRLEFGTCLSDREKIRNFRTVIKSSFAKRVLKRLKHVIVDKRK